uniref:ARAD1D38610p n=1 Tax=Blastobotrys adeninivorans TaxID=409370 RepID=A0A060TC01_BLAAD
MSDEVQKLKDDVARLAEQVRKNSKAIVDTGRHVLSLEVDKERKSLKSLGISSEPKPSRIPGDESDDEDEEGNGKKPATSDDIVELVTELQVQLDLLDDRSMRRSANAFATEDTDAIAPMPSRDGGYPGDKETLNDGEIAATAPFPKTLGEFKQMSDSQVDFWARWYELLPPDEVELRDILARAGTTMEELGVDKPPAVERSKEESDNTYDTLARFFGLRTRRTKGAW